jgi:transposase
MTGPEFKEMAKGAGLKAPELAESLGVSIQTIYAWFGRAQLDRVIEIAIRQTLGPNHNLSAKTASGHNK